MQYPYHDFKRNITGATLSADAQLGCDMILSEMAKAILLSSIKVKDVLKSNGIEVKDKIISSELGDLLINNMAENLQLRKDMAAIISKAQPFEREVVKGYKQRPDVKKYKTATNSAGFQTTYNVDKAKETDKNRQERMVVDGIHQLYTIMKSAADKENKNLKEGEKINYLTLIKQDLSNKINSYKTIYNMADGTGNNSSSSSMGAVLVLVLVTGWLIYLYSNQKKVTPAIAAAPSIPPVIPTP